MDAAPDPHCGVGAAARRTVTADGLFLVGTVAVGAVAMGCMPSTERPASRSTHGPEAPKSDPLSATSPASRTGSSGARNALHF
jgi:hypothetical protein